MSSVLNKLPIPDPFSFLQPSFAMEAIAVDPDLYARDSAYSPDDWQS
jgi:hypothetical protein